MTKIKKEHHSYLSRLAGHADRKISKVSRQLSSIVHPLFPKLHAIRDTLDDADMGYDMMQLALQARLDIQTRLFLCCA